MIPTEPTASKDSSQSRAAAPGPAKASLSDENLLSSFDPVIEVGERFGESVPDEEAAPVDAASFDLARSLQAIPDKLFFRIGEVADLLELKTYVLRFWETEFPNVHPTKSRTGQRVYRRKDVETLFLIKHLLYVERFSIEGARKRLKEMRARKTAPAVETPSAAGVATMAAAKAGGRGDETRLRSLAEELRTLLERDPIGFFRYL